MNIFHDYEGIYGIIKTEDFSNNLKEFLSLSNEIRNKLGKKSYLFDKYLLDILKAINSIHPFDVAESGSQASSDLRSLIRHKLSNLEKENDHPLYEKVSRYIDEHIFDYQEDETIMDLYIIGLMNEYLPYAVKEYAKECYDSVRAEMDIIYSQQLYRKISELLGSEELMEQLNSIISQRFIIASPMSIFVQSLTANLIYSLTHRDIETGKMVFMLAPIDAQEEGLN